MTGSLLACSSLLLQAQATPSGDIAIVVNSEVPIANLSFDDLRKLVLGDKQYWAGSLRITLLLRAPVARERDVVLRKVYDMNEAQFRQYWIGKVFRAETASGPKIVYSNATYVATWVQGVALPSRPEIAWRYVFLFGLVPAAVAFAVRMFVKEPERWKAARPAGIPAALNPSYIY